MIPSRTPKSSLPLLCGAVLSMLILGGCAEQDLYTPPGAPVHVIGRLPLPSVNEGVAVLGSYAFVAGGQAGLHVIDLADPSQPVLVRTLNTTKYAESIEVVRTFAQHTLVDIALVVEGTEGITSYNITDPPNLFSFNQGTTAVDGQRIYVDQPLDPDEPYIVYLAESWKGLRVFESEPGTPGLLAYNGVFAGTQGYAMGVAVRDGYAYVADDEMGLAVIDARELVLGAVQLVSWQDSPGNAMDVALEGGYAFVADGTAGLAVYAVNGADEPRKLADLDLSGFCRSIAVRDHLACLAAAGGGVHFVDVADPAHPVYLGTVVTSYATDLDLADDGLVLVSDRDDGLLVLGGHGPFQDAAAPAPVTSLEATPYSTQGIQLAWYATGDDGMIGTAAACRIRQATTPILDAAAWEAAAAVEPTPAPAAPGQHQTLLVQGLSPGVEYHFAIRFEDEVGKLSPLGNSASATPFTGIVLADPTLDRLYGTDQDLYTYEVIYRYSQAPTQAEIVIDDNRHETMSYVDGDFASGARYRYQTSLAVGEHTYAFQFAAADGAHAELPSITGPVVGSVVFTMGSLGTEPGRDPDEVLHGVALSHGAVASPHEVTQAEWEAMAMANNSHFRGATLPVETVTWFEAVEYCNRLSTSAGLTPAYVIAGESVSWNKDADGWRLPTEAEWEWLCRAGSATAFAGGDITVTLCLGGSQQPDPVLDGLGWYCGNAGNVTHDVQGKNPNAGGLYDMHGNVWEWCWDWYGALAGGPVLDPEGPPVGFQRVIRGGSWYYYASDCRSARRGSYYPTSADDVVGLRVVRTVFSD
jgi:formylglycine-generating enzyme required for sulfatase activity